MDGTSVGAGPSYTFSSVSANHTISATFTALTYTITGSAGSNGAISPSGAATVTYGGSRELYHHAFFGLPGGGGYGGRDLGWRGTELHVIECYGQSHHCGHIYRLNLYDNG